MSNPILEILDSTIMKFKDGYVPNKLYLIIPEGTNNPEFREYWLNNGFHLSTDENVLESN